MYGVLKSPDPRKAMLVLEELTALFPIVPMGIDVAKTYGTMRSELASRGELIGNNDLWIAAHARSLGRSLGLTLVTNNEREFQRMAGLTIENWASGSSRMSD